LSYEDTRDSVCPGRVPAARCPADHISTEDPMPPTNAATINKGVLPSTRTHDGKARNHRTNATVSRDLVIGRPSAADRPRDRDTRNPRPLVARLVSCGPRSARFGLTRLTTPKDGSPPHTHGSSRNTASRRGCRRGRWTCGSARPPSGSRARHAAANRKGSSRRDRPAAADGDHQQTEALGPDFVASSPCPHRELACRKCSFPSIRHHARMRVW